MPKSIEQKMVEILRRLSRNGGLAPKIRKGRGFPPGTIVFDKSAKKVCTVVASVQEPIGLNRVLYLLSTPGGALVPRHGEFLKRLPARTVAASVRADIERLIGRLGKFISRITERRLPWQI